MSWKLIALHFFLVATMTRETTKFERYLCFLTLEEKLYELDKFVEALLIDKHPKKNVKHQYKILKELRLKKSQLTK